MSVSDKITQLNTIRTNIRQALAEQKIYTDTHDYSDFADDIETIKTSNHRLPSEYQEVEYIKSTGSQYIQTDLILKGTDRIEMDTTITSSFTRFLYCTRVGYKDTTMSLLPARLDYYNNQYAYTNLPIGTLINIVQDGGTLYVNGTQRVATTTQNFTATYPLVIMTGYFPYGTYSDPLPMELKRFAVKNGSGGYKMNLIPCYRIADDVIGMYDTITGTFLTNSGTGTFGKGADV